jgi:hypothetical protein
LSAGSDVARRAFGFGVLRRGFAGLLLVYVCSPCCGPAPAPGLPTPSIPVEAVLAPQAPPVPEPELEPVPTASTCASPLRAIVTSGDGGPTIWFDERAGYAVERAGGCVALPRAWIEGAEPRRDLSVSRDGARLAVPEPIGLGATVYDLRGMREIGHFDFHGDMPTGGGWETRLSNDGRRVVFLFSRRPCAVTDIATGRFDDAGARHGACSGGDIWGKGDFR